MRRVDDYRQNARECRDLAQKIGGEVRAHLERMARQWDELAEERERYLATRGGTDEPDPTTAFKID